MILLLLVRFILCACILTESTNTSQVVQIKQKLLPLSIKSLNIWEIPFTQDLQEGLLLRKLCTLY